MMCKPFHGAIYQKPRSDSTNRLQKLCDYNVEMPVDARIKTAVHEVGTKMMENLAYYFYKSGHSLYEMRIPFLPSLMKLMIRILFGAVIPPQLEIGKDVLFGYNGLGIVIHPNCKIGNNVIISQHVTIGGRKGPGVPIIGNNVFIGAGAQILGGIRICDNARIGANAVVLTDVPNNATAVGVPARIILKPAQAGAYSTQEDTVGESSSKLFCRHCSVENRTDAVFCDRCGRKLREGYYC